MASVFRMALRRATALPTVMPSASLASTRPFVAAATPYSLLRRPYSTTEEAAPTEDLPTVGNNEPPFMATLRENLKAAMRARDQIRLDVIRSIIAEVSNSTKTPLPIETDIHMIRLLRRMRMRQADAAADFMVAGRKDLAEREISQMGIIKQFEEATGIATVTREEISKIVKGVIADIYSDPSHMSRLDLRTVIQHTERELRGRDVLKSDIVFEANAQVKAKRMG